MTPEPEQGELFTERYIKLIADHQVLQQNFAKVWAENARRRLEQEELEQAIIMLLHRAGLNEVLLHPSERTRASAFTLERSMVLQATLYRPKVKP